MTLFSKSFLDTTPLLLNSCLEKCNILHVPKLKDIVAKAAQTKEKDTGYRATMVELGEGAY